MDFLRKVFILTAMAFAAPLCAQLPQPAQPQALQQPTPYGPPPISITDIALAYTGEEEGMQVQIEAWDPAGPTMGGMLGARIDYFLVEPAPIVLENGERFELDDLRITAFGLDGDVLAGAPLKLSLEAPEGMLSLDLAVESRSLFALGPGIARLWVDALLPRGTGTGEHYRLPVVILVHEPASPTLTRRPL
ncbi:MAG: hypothetical protein HKN84_06815 [Gammaproteobacteria bacterium]|nr:hypothetical protein [Gammaproteobacteria bacterium]